CNVETKDAGFVFALERDEVATGVEHGDGERSAIGLAALFEGGVDDGAGLSEGDGHDGSFNKVLCLTNDKWKRITSPGASTNRRRGRRPRPRRGRDDLLPRNTRGSSRPEVARSRGPCPRSASCADP